ncbi:MAG TPA: glycosyltransferase family 39 protein, partial [Pyrinomonadaceae bacterium]|nr:glycosyltransferase family 39 protein [Pyrinomonadaceae bacterium]
MTWHDTRLEVGKVQTTVTANYQNFARLLRQEGMWGFFSSSSPLADTNHLGHPPGYSILIAFVRSDVATQFVQITFDALSAVLIFLIVAEMFSSGAGVIAGLMAAFSPQLAWNSVLLLPDSIAVFPILLAVYLVAISRKHPRLLVFVAVGVLVGISCWLRANAMLMTIFFAAAMLVCTTN